MGDELGREKRRIEGEDSVFKFISAESQSTNSIVYKEPLSFPIQTTPARVRPPPPPPPPSVLPPIRTRNPGIVLRTMH